MRPSRRYLARCVAAGCLWGAIALVLGVHARAPFVGYGVAASPVIGLIVALLVFRMPDVPEFFKVSLSLLALYGAAALFGLVLGVASASQAGPNVLKSERVFEHVMAVLWGITFTGYIVFLWPLAYFTQDWARRGDTAKKGEN